jgi:hypothetical protein
MLEELIQLQERFQPFLRNRDYTFIGPEDQSLFEPFMNRANDLAPIVGIIRESRHFLNNKTTAIQALDVLPEDAQLRIYVVDGSIENVLLHDTIENYCKRHDIEFEI